MREWRNGIRTCLSHRFLGVQSLHSTPVVAERVPKGTQQPVGIVIENVCVKHQLRCCCNTLRQERRDAVLHRLAGVSDDFQLSKCFPPQKVLSDMRKADDAVPST